MLIFDPSFFSFSGSYPTDLRHHGRRTQRGHGGPARNGDLEEERSFLVSADLGVVGVDSGAEGVVLHLETELEEAPQVQQSSLKSGTRPVSRFRKTDFYLRERKESAGDKNR